MTKLVNGNGEEVRLRRGRVEVAVLATLTILAAGGVAGSIGTAMQLREMRGEFNSFRADLLVRIAESEQHVRRHELDRLAAEVKELRAEALAAAGQRAPHRHSENQP